MTYKMLNEEGGVMQMLEQLGLADTMLHSDLNHVNNVQNVAEVALDCTFHMLNTEA